MRRMNKRLLEVWPEVATGGIFTALSDLGVPWAEDIDPVLLDLDYYYNNSGGKLVSPLVYHKLVDGSLPSTEVENLASIALAINGVSWLREYATLDAEYDPIDNYNMVEVMTDDQTVDEFGHVTTRDTDMERTHTGKDTRTDDLTDAQTLDLSHEKTGTETKTPDTTIEAEDTVYGFNSAEGVPTNARTQSASGTEETEYDLVDADTGTDTTTHTGTSETEYDTSEHDVGSHTDTESGSNTRTRNYTLSRRGNIGVTTSQQMLQAERDLWLWNFFREVVYPSLDTILTIPVY